LLTRILWRLGRFVTVAALVAFASSSVDAAPIAVATGSAKQSVIVTAAQDMGLANPGTLLATMTDAFDIGGGHVVGSVISAVYQNAAGYLDFYYQVVNTTSPSTSSSNISGIAGHNFGGASTSVGYYTNAAVFGGIFQSPVWFSGAWNAPVMRAADRSADGNFVNMWFGPPWGSTTLNPNEVSAIFMVSTNATTFGAGWATVQNGGPASTDTVHSFQVPEPMSIGLALVGFGILMGARRRQNR
jgi:hypothetical protein